MLRKVLYTIQYMVTWLRFFSQYISHFTLLSLSLSIGLGVAPSHISLYKYVYDICHICLLRSPPSERWQLSSSLFTPPTYLLGFPGPCARPQAIGWNGHQSQGNQGLKERGFDARFPLLFVNFGDKLRWMLPIYGDTFMAKHSTSICQWSWFSIESLPTSRILAPSLSWQNMPWKVQLVSKNSTTTTTATRYICWMMHPKNRPLAVLPSPNSRSEKSAVSFRMRCQNWQMVVVKDFSVYETGLQSHRIVTLCYLLFYGFTFEYSGSQPCPMFIHSHTFFPFPCKQKEKYCKYLFL